MYIVRKISPLIKCFECCEALLAMLCPIDHQYCLPSTNSLLTNRKNCGGLVIPSDPAYKVVEIAEKNFKAFVTVSNEKQITSEKFLVQKIVNKTLNSCNWHRIFQTRLPKNHGFEISAGFEDDHITQLVKAISSKYLVMRLYTYGKKYTTTVLNKNKPSTRHQMNKLTLFKNI